MRFFARNKKAIGCMAVTVREEGIGAAHIKRSSSNQPVVAFLAFYPTNTSTTVAALEKLAKELPVNRFDCSTLLAPDDYQLLSVEAPNVPSQEMKAAIRWRLKDMLDFHIDDATIDVLEVPADKNAAGRTHSMYAVAARNQVIEQHQALFSETRIPLTIIDIPEMAQRNISALVEPEGRGLALLSFDEKGGLLTVTFSGELFLSRRIDVTLSQLKTTDADQKNACFDRITLELQRSLDHFDRQYHFIAVSKLLVAPLGDEVSGLQEYLATNLYIPVEALNLQSVLDISKAPELKSLDMQQRYFLTLGAALRHEERAS